MSASSNGDEHKQVWVSRYNRLKMHTSPKRSDPFPALKSRYLREQPEFFPKTVESFISKGFLTFISECIYCIFTALRCKSLIINGASEENRTHHIYVREIRLDFGYLNCNFKWHSICMTYRYNIYYAITL